MGDLGYFDAAGYLHVLGRSADRVVRHGQALNPREIEEVAQRIVTAMALPFQLSSGPVNISASVGVAIYPRHGDDLEAIRAGADAALYSVKQSGRNGYRLFVPNRR
jgi:diguanylate cyclase (GGDEF)-like protein